MTRLRTTLVLLLAVALLPAAAADAAKPKPLRIVVSNDDGVKAPGIDALVEGLQTLPRVKITVVAPAENQSGSGGKTTPGTLATTKTTTAGGYPAIAVAGYPADAMNVALTKVVKPAQVDLVVSGINQGANLGPFVDLSGTVGAARAAATRGLPALATSMGTSTTTDFSQGVTQTLNWVRKNRGKYRKGTVENLNVPQCSAGSVRGTVAATSTTTLPAGVNPFVPVDCNQTAAAGPDEITDFLLGFATLTRIPLRPAS